MQAIICQKRNCVLLVTSLLCTQRILIDANLRICYKNLTTYIYTYMHVYMHTYIHSYIHTYIPANVCTLVFGINLLYDYF